MNNKSEAINFIYSHYKINQKNNPFITVNRNERII